MAIRLYFDVLFTESKIYKIGQILTGIRSIQHTEDDAHLNSRLLFGENRLQQLAQLIVMFLGSIESLVLDKKLLLSALDQAQDRLVEVVGRKQGLYGEAAGLIKWSKILERLCAFLRRRDEQSSGQ